MSFLSNNTSEKDFPSEDMQCPLCFSNMLMPFLHRRGVPALANQLLETQEAACQVQRGNISLVVCHHCGFVFNSAFASSSLYTELYDNSQVYAPSFEHYLNARVHTLVTEHHVHHCRIIEVGCGDGTFLRKLVAAGTGNTGYGFDPSYRGPTHDLDGRLQFAAYIYDETSCAPAADVLVCRHVIEHIPRPFPFLRSLHRALAHSPHARAFFETPTIEWILRNGVMWDIYYEHCSYFSAETITFALERSGFKVQHIEYTFEGQYLWVEVTRGNSEETPLIPMVEPDSLLSLALQFQQQEQRFCEEWQQTLEVLRRDGPIAIVGAAGKGVTLANLIDPDRQFISCLVDLNPQKQQKFLPGTGHPIISYEQMKTYGIVSAILLNPNYFHDTLQFFKFHRLSPKLITDPITSLAHKRE